MTDHPQNTRSQPICPRSGMTLVEVVVALGVGSMVLAAVALIWVFTGRSFVAMGNYAEMDNASRNTLDLMSREIREARALTAYHSNRITLANPIGSLEPSFSYIFDPTAATLVRSNSVGNKKILLRGCDYVTFSFSQRNVTNAFQFFPATTAPTIKLVDVSWKCSRKKWGTTQLNTESVQTAKIVLRN